MHYHFCACVYALSGGDALPFLCMCVCALRAVVMRYLSVRVCMRSQGGTLDVGEGAEGTAPCDFVVVPVGRRVPPQGSSESGQGRQGGIGEPGGGQQRLGERQEGQGGGVLGGSGGQQGLGDTQHLLDGGGGITTEEWRVSCGPHKVCGWYFFNPILLFWGKWQHNRGVVGFLRAAQGVWMVFFLSYSSFLGEVAAQ